MELGRHRRSGPIASFTWVTAVGLAGGEVGGARGSGRAHHGRSSAAISARGPRHYEVRTTARIETLAGVATRTAGDGGLRGFHDGHGDYVAWQTAGLAVLAATLTLLLR
jgi:hypothetical protein